VNDAWDSIRTRVADPVQQNVVMVDRAARRSPVRGPYLAAAAVLVVALIGGTIALANRGSDDAGTTEVDVGTDDAPAPARGGTIRYGIPDLPVSGFCLPEAQLATDDEIVAGALYDPLFAFDAEGSASPYLAESASSNDDHTMWTITLRSGVTFHDGSVLDAAVVKGNIDAWRGADPNRMAVLQTFRFQAIESVEVVGDLVVEVTTEEPWSSLPAVMASPSLGIMARAQLNGDQAACANEPIGTGPFALESWDHAGGTLRLVRNPDYWQLAPDGEAYPYLDAVEFVSGAGPAHLADSQVDAVWTDSATGIAGPLAQMEASGSVVVDVTYETAQPAFVLLNHSAGPFDDLSMRRALAMSLDRAGLAAQVGLGDVVIADGPFPPSGLGHLADTGFPGTDLDAARSIVADHVGAGGSAAFDLYAAQGTDDEAVALAIEAQAEAVGFEVTVIPAKTAVIVDNAIGANFQAAIFRNPASPDPDQTAIYWAGDVNPVNFSDFEHPTVDELLARGRSTADRSERAEAYESLNRFFAEQVPSIWLWFQPAAVVTRPGMGSVVGPELPDGALPATDLGSGHRLLAMTAP